MQLNYNSFSAKLYRWFYNVDFHHEMPNNLCPYFWKLVLMWLMILPYVLVTLPGQVITLFSKKSVGESIGYTFAFYFVVLVVTVFMVLPISYLFDLTFEEKTFWNSMLNGSIFFWFVSILFGLYYLIKFIVTIIRDKMYQKNSDEKYHSVKKPNIVVEFVKAKYNKYCPKIDWNNERNND